MKLLLVKFLFPTAGVIMSQYLNNKPQNSNLIGDILVDSVFYDPVPTNRYSLLRFGGELAKLNAAPFNIPAFGSDNSDDFCNKSGTQ